MPDLSGVDSSTKLGQLTFLLVAVSLVIGALRQNVKLKIARPMKRSYRALLTEVETLREEARYLHNSNKFLARWQIIARELIRVLRNALAESDARETEQAKILIRRLDDLDQEITNSVLGGEEDGKDN